MDQLAVTLYEERCKPTKQAHGKNWLLLIIRPDPRAVFYCLLASLMEHVGRGVQIPYKHKLLLQPLLGKPLMSDACSGTKLH